MAEGGWACHCGSPRVGIWALAALMCLPGAGAWGEVPLMGGGSIRASDTVGAVRLAHPEWPWEAGPWLPEGTDVWEPWLPRDPQDEADPSPDPAPLPDEDPPVVIDPISVYQFFAAMGSPVSGPISFGIGGSGRLALLIARAPDVGLDGDLPSGLPNGPDRLVLGGDGGAVTVRLVDERSGDCDDGQAAALYLIGSRGADGLEIHDGSLLVLGDDRESAVQLYALIDGRMQHVNSWFAPGQTEIPFDDGFIVLPEPSAGLLLAGAALGLLSRKRRRRRMDP